MKTLVLMNARFELDRYYIRYGSRENLTLTSLYRIYKKGFVYRVAALWMQKLKFPFQSVWYDDWKKEIKNYDLVIVFASNLSWEVLAYIRKKNPNARLILWFCDTISEKVSFDEKYHKICEVWSFDKLDCQKFGFKENTQFYLERESFGENKILLYDAMFVGREKGRKKILNEIVDKLNCCNLKVYKYILRDKSSREKESYVHKKGMEYDELLHIIEQSACIIDIPKENQSGMTLRVMESIFNSKKLITTNKSLIKEEFYNPQNILVWDNPSEERIKDFFSQPFVPISREICSKYTIEQWVKNFG